MLLSICGVLSVFAAIAVANRLAVLGDIADRSFGPDIVNRAQDADDLASAAGWSLAIASLVTAIVFIMWFFRAAKNNEALGRQNPRFGPGWAIGGWFIPLANLVIPVLIAQDLWRGSDSSAPRGDPRWRIAPRSALVGWWWALWIFGFGVRAGAGGGSTDDNRLTLSEVQTSNRIALVGLIISVGAAILAILMVRKITERQEECLRAQREAWRVQAGAPPPA